MNTPKRLYIGKRDLMPFLSYVVQLSPPQPETSDGTGAQSEVPLPDIAKWENGLKLRTFAGRTVNMDLLSDESGLYIEDADHWEGHTDEQWQDLRAFLGQDTTDPATFVFTNDLTPISKQGGEVEESCRRMLSPGCNGSATTPGRLPSS